VTEPDRRKYRRVNAPIFIQPVGPLQRHTLRDVSLSGLRAYSDDPHELGERLQIELMLPDKSSISVLVEVAWVSALPSKSPALYDIGLRYIDIELEEIERLSVVLEKE
jgi:hypothetical protein